VNETLDDLELELRRLPGVVSVSLRGNERLEVHICLTNWADLSAVRQRAELLVLAHHEHPQITVSRAGEGLATEGAAESA
jgi:hypothetical protein